MKLGKAAAWLGSGAIAAGVAAYAVKTQLDERRGRPKAPPYPLAREPIGRRLEVVHEFRGAPIPTGVTVSRTGRVFVCHPRWEDPVSFTVAELRDGAEVPFPSAELNDPSHPDHLFSVQSVVIDPRDRLWALDTGSVNMAPIKGRAWAKLVGIDLASGQVVKTIRFPSKVVHEKTYLNDVRFDLRRGADGVAFITDSSSKGGLIVVDLATGRSWRRLHDHPSVKPDRRLFALVETTLLPPFGGSDGISLEASGTRLWFCALSSRAIHSVSLDALADEQATDDEVARTLYTEQRAFASDGLEADAQGNLYLTDWEHNAVIVRRASGEYETLVADPRMWWPDTLSVTDDGWLYFTANQLHRLPKLHFGRDLREGSAYLFRIGCGGRAIRLGAPG